MAPRPRRSPAPAVALPSAAELRARYDAACDKTKLLWTPHCKSDAWIEAVEAGTRAWEEMTKNAK